MSLAAFAAPSFAGVGKASPGLSGPGLERSHTPDREHLGPAHGAGRALLCAPAVCAFLAAFRNKRSIRRQAAKEDAQVQTMERPLLDNVITAGVKALEAAELKRVRSSSESPSDANGNWGGEPREWANSDSITQQISTVSQMGPLAQAKQFIADRLAGEYDAERIGSLIDEKVASNKIMMFSFSTCPFCLRAKQILQEDYGEEIEVYECDQEADGYAVRAELGRRTGRTSMPSVYLGSSVYLGGCNDGGLGGIATLDKQELLGNLLAERNAAMSSFAPLDWLAALGQPDRQETLKKKKALLAACAEAPKNGVGASDAVKDKVEAAAVDLEALCPSNPAQASLEGVWDLQYCTAEGSSNGKVGPFLGDVTQTFVDDVQFVNAVEIGPVKVALQAEREVLNDTEIRVTFKETVFSILGIEIFRKPTKGAGTWKQRFVDAGLRVMDTPSLFVLRKRRS